MTDNNALAQELEARLEPLLADRYGDADPRAKQMVSVTKAEAEAILSALRSTPQPVPASGEVGTLVRMLSAVTTEEGCSVFEHSAEEIGVEVMEHHKAVLERLAGAGQQVDAYVAERRDSIDRGARRSDHRFKLIQQPGDDALVEVAARAMARQHNMFDPDMEVVGKKPGTTWPYWREFEEDARAVLTALAPHMSGGEKVRHKKRGTVYTIVGEAELQMSHDLLVDGSNMIVYRDNDGRLWVQEEGEFHDGRFEALNKGDSNA